MPATTAGVFESDFAPTAVTVTVSVAGACVPLLVSVRVLLVTIEPEALSTMGCPTTVRLKGALDPLVGFGHSPVVAL